MKKILLSLSILGFLAFSVPQVQASPLEGLVNQILTLRSGLVKGDSADLTPRIMYWYGKVNQHVDPTASWISDPDGVSGADIPMLNYCKKWYPTTTSVVAYGNETSTTWSAGTGATGTYTSIKPSYKCVGGVMYGTSSYSLPTVITSGVSGINEQSALVSGDVTSAGGVEVTERGIVWGVSLNPTIANNKQIASTTGTGAFMARAIGLSPSTTYHTRAYAINSVGIVYGLDVSFITTAFGTTTTPTVTTSPVTNITQTSATLNGNAISDGGATITERGLVWGTALNPTVLNNKQIDSSWGTGLFSKTITGLTANATYNVRAYATNEKGTVYGSNVSFKTSAVVVPVNGGWSAWANTGNCVNSLQTQTRTCTNPAPANGGATCSGSTTQTISCSTASSVTVTYPNGGEVLTAGQPLTIRWTSNNIGATELVNVYIYVPSRNLSIAVATRTPNDGSETYDYTGYLDEYGNIFKAVVSPATVGVVQDQSDDFFTINSANYSTPSITVTSPNGGETFTAGQQITVKWNSSNIPTNVKNIQMSIGYKYRVPGEDKDRTSSRTLLLESDNFKTENDGTETINLPSVEELKNITGYNNYGLPYSGKYYNIILSYIPSDYLNVYDISDNLFTIISSTNPNPVSPCAPYGDVNGDGYISDNDVNMIQQKIAGTLGLTYDQHKRGDVNADGVLTIADVNYVRDYSTKTITTFPVCSATPSITVLSPNGGDTLVKDTTHRITWSDSTPPLYVSGGTSFFYYDLTLESSPTPCPIGSACITVMPMSYTITNNLKFAQGIKPYLDWIVGKATNGTITSIPDGSYKVKICKTGTTECDTSDNYFKITSTNLIGQTIDLKLGWNIISFNLKPSDLSLNSVFTQMTPGVGEIIENEDGVQAIYTANGWSGGFNSIDTLKAYRVKVSKDKTLTVSGSQISIDTPIPLKSGINLVPYYPTVETDVVTAFSAIKSTCLQKVIDEQGNTYENWGVYGGWTNNIGKLKPGEGYKVITTISCTLNYNPNNIIVTPPSLLNPQCSDGLDNDGDTMFDNRDANCYMGLNLSKPNNYIYSFDSENSNDLLTARTLKLTYPLMRGTDVSALQKYLGISQDGVYGRQTMSAIKAWQTKNGLNADGVFGPACFAKMYMELFSLSHI